MSTRENNKDFENKLKEKREKEKHRKKMHTKHVNSNLNLKLSLFIFIVMCVIALFLVLNKGKIGDFSLVYVEKNNIHTAEVECEVYYLSILDDEETRATVWIDGKKIASGYTLESSNPNIVRVEGEKIIAGSEPGTATITAKIDDSDMDITTEVVSYIPINTVMATISSSTISVGEEAEMEVSIIPDDGTDDYITYKSSDKSVATVNEKGIVTGVAEGEATILIEDQLTGASATKTVTVE